MKTWTKLKNLTLVEAKLLLQALLLLPAFHLGLKWFGYYRINRFIDNRFPVEQTGNKTNKEDALRISEITTRMVSAASRYGLYHATCLRKSIVLVYLLRKQGIESEVCIGTRRNGGTFEAHAWVEYEGTVINDRADIRENYTLLEDQMPSSWAGL